MKRLFVVAAALALAACSSMPSWMPGSGWTTLSDGDKGLENFERVGDANWRAEGGAIVDGKGKGGGLFYSRGQRESLCCPKFGAVRSLTGGVHFDWTLPRD